MGGGNISMRSVVRATRDEVCCDVAGETVILHLDSGTYYGLNAVGSRIWELLQEPCAVSAVRHALVAEYHVDPGRCETDLIRLLEQLAAERLIEVIDEAPG